MRSFSHGAVATIAVCKSAPVSLIIEIESVAVNYWVGYQR